MVVKRTQTRTNLKTIGTAQKIINSESKTQMKIYQLKRIVFVMLQN